MPNAVQVYEGDGVDPKAWGSPAMDARYAKVLRMAQEDEIVDSLKEMFYYEVSSETRLDYPMVRAELASLTDLVVSDLRDITRQNVHLLNVVKQGLVRAGKPPSSQAILRRALQIGYVRVSGTLMIPVAHQTLRDEALAFTLGMSLLVIGFLMATVGIFCAVAWYRSDDLPQYAMSAVAVLVGWCGIIQGSCAVSRRGKP